MTERHLPVVRDSNEDAKTCTTCGGNCCKAVPGILAPEDVGAPELSVMRERLTSLFATGRYAIDWWEGDPRPTPREGYLGCVEYVRPAVKGEEGELRDPSWGGPCTFLGPSGCELTFDDRPHNCRALVPRRGPQEGCELPVGARKVDYVLAWLPYRDLLAEFGEVLREKAS